MPFAVQLTDDATRDLEEIVDYISRQDGTGSAEYVLERIEQAFQALSALPERGSYPRELLDLGIRKYREVFFKPYRIIYRVKGRRGVRDGDRGRAAGHAGVAGAAPAGWVASGLTAGLARPRPRARGASVAWTGPPRPAPPSSDSYRVRRNPGIADPQNGVAPRRAAMSAYRRPTRAPGRLRTPGHRLPRGGRKSHHCWLSENPCLVPEHAPGIHQHKSSSAS